MSTEGPSEPSPGGDADEVEAEPEVDGDGDELDVVDEIVIAALIEGRPRVEAAAVGGYTDRTLRRRMQDRAFRRRLAERRDERVGQIAGQLGGLVDEAMQALQEALHSERTADQLRAVGLVLDRYRLFRGELEVADELTDLRQELIALQAAVAARTGQENPDA